MTRFFNHKTCASFKFFFLIFLIQVGAEHNKLGPFLLFGEKNNWNLKCARNVMSTPTNYNINFICEQTKKIILFIEHTVNHTKS